MQFEVGELYSAEEIQQRLEVGNAGGIRVSLDGQRQVRRVVLLTAAPTAKIQRENPYHDRIEGDVLVYAAAGLHGDQTLGGVNNRLSLQPNSHFPIYGFRLNENRRKAGVRRWEFLGLLQFLRLYPDNQIDRAGALRKAWLFELRVCVEFPKVRISEARALTSAAFADFKFDGEREARADSGIDVNARVSPVQWPIADVRVQVQAKRWLHTVGRREVAELRGSLEPFAQGAIVTTSFFSRAAIAEAQAGGRQPIVLVDGYHFAVTVKWHGLIAA